MNLAGLTTEEVGAAALPLLAIPVGSCEQHGPHLPLATDSIIAEALAARLAERMPGVLVGPTIAVTASGEHAGFPGTLSIGSDITCAVLVELSRSAGWAAGIVLVNGHGGNVDAVGAAVSTIRAEGRPVEPWWPAVGGGDAHGGRTETSLMLAVRPDLVRPHHDVVGCTRPLRELTVELRTHGVRAVSPNGVLGDARGATLEAGVRLLDQLTSDLVHAARRAALGWSRPLP